MNKPNGIMTASVVVAGKQIFSSELNQIFGVIATSTWKAKPEVIAQVPELDKEEWRFELPAKACFSFSDGIDSLVDLFYPQLDKIAIYCKKQELKISFHIQLDGMDRNFILGFDRAATVHNLAKIDAKFYIHTQKLKCLNAYE